MSQAGIGLAIGLAVLFAASGCAATYDEPSSGPVARIKLSANRVGARGAYVYSDERCSNPAVISPLNEGEWVNVRAGEPLWMQRTFNSVGSTQGFYCAPATTFRPLEGASYLIDFHAEPNACRVTVRRVEASGELIPELTARPFDHPNCQHF
jgi:hypothetical protein